MDNPKNESKTINTPNDNKNPAASDLSSAAGSQFRLWDGEYEKVWYDVRIPETGEVIRCCWPNAGKMCNFMNDINEQWSAGEIEIRESDKHPLDLHSENDG